jgi:hypothetical protein
MHVDDILICLSLRSNQRFEWLFHFRWSCCAFRKVFLHASGVGRTPEGVAVIAVDLIMAFAGWSAFDVVPAGVFGVVPDHFWGEVRCGGDGDVTVPSCCRTQVSTGGSLDFSGARVHWD